MSTSSLSSFQSKIRLEQSESDTLCQDLKGLSKTITEVMDDRVGRRASESALGISGAFSNSSDKIINKCNDAAVTLEQGYSKIDRHSSQCEKLLSDAQKLVKELGNL